MFVAPINPTILEVVEKHVGMISLVFGAVVSAIGWLVTAVRRNTKRDNRIAEVEEKVGKLEKRVEENTVDHDRIVESLNKLNVAVERITVALVGIDGTNGLRGELRELKQQVQEIRESLMQPTA